MQKTSAEISDESIPMKVTESESENEIVAPPQEFLDIEPDIVFRHPYRRRDIILNLKKKLLRTFTVRFT